MLATRFAGECVRHRSLGSNWRPFCLAILVGVQWLFGKNFHHPAVQRRINRLNFWFSHVGNPSCRGMCKAPFTWFQFAAFFSAILVGVQWLFGKHFHHPPVQRRINRLNFWFSHVGNRRAGACVRHRSLGSNWRPFFGNPCWCPIPCGQLHMTSRKQNTKWKWRWWGNHFNSWSSSFLCWVLLATDLLSLAIAQRLWGGDGHGYYSCRCSS